MFIIQIKFFSKKTILLLIFLFLAFGIFRLQSNIEFIFPQNNKLITKSDKIEYEDETVCIHIIKISRTNESFIHRIKNKLFPAKIIIFDFNKDNIFSLYANIDDDFSPVTSKSALKNSNAIFALNTNFYDQNNRVVGELIINGKTYGSVSNGSGFFKVINNTPYVGPKSVFNNIEGKVQYSCQAFPSVMKNGIVFSYINKETYPYKKLWRKKTYRNLIGSKSNGNIVIVVSNDGALLSVKEITQIAKKFNVKNASLFDGGIALQYSFKSKNYKNNFSTLNNTFGISDLFEKLTILLFNKKFKQKSPVFLTIKPNQK